MADKKKKKPATIIGETLTLNPVVMHSKPVIALYTPSKKPKKKGRK